MFKRKQAHAQFLFIQKKLKPEDAARLFLSVHIYLQTHKKNS